jgi:hypothetical protein
MRKNSKRIRTTLVIVALIVVGWLIGNVRGALRMPGEQAAVVVVQHYAPSHAANLRARRVASDSNGWPAPATFIVTCDDRDFAKVTLVNVLGLGWQEDKYVALR